MRTSPGLIRFGSDPITVRFAAQYEGQVVEMLAGVALAPSQARVIDQRLSPARTVYAVASPVVPAGDLPAGVLAAGGLLPDLLPGAGGAGADAGADAVARAVGVDTEAVGAGVAPAGGEVALAVGCAERAGTATVLLADRWAVADGVAFGLAALRAALVGEPVGTVAGAWFPVELFEPRLAWAMV